MHSTDPFTFGNSNRNNNSNQVRQLKCIRCKYWKYSPQFTSGQQRCQTAICKSCQEEMNKQDYTNEDQSGNLIRLIDIGEDGLPKGHEPNKGQTEDSIRNQQLVSKPRVSMRIRKMIHEPLSQ